MAMTYNVVDTIHEIPFLVPSLLNPNGNCSSVNIPGPMDSTHGFHGLLGPGTHGSTWINLPDPSRGF